MRIPIKQAGPRGTGTGEKDDSCRTFVPLACAVLHPRLDVALRGDVERGKLRKPTIVEDVEEIHDRDLVCNLTGL